MKIQDMEIIAQIEQQESIAYGVNDSSLSDDRAEAIDYYLGQPFGNEEEGHQETLQSPKDRQALPHPIAGVRCRR